MHKLSVVFHRFVALSFHLKRGVLQTTAQHVVLWVCSLVAGFKMSKACSFNHAGSRLQDFQHTSASSLPASFLYAFVHLTFLGFRFILKFLWHLLRQKLNTCSKVAHLVSMLP
jgi:hypothetical protein